MPSPAADVELARAGGAPALRPLPFLRLHLFLPPHPCSVPSFPTLCAFLPLFLPPLPPAPLPPAPLSPASLPTTLSPFRSLSPPLLLPLPPLPLLLLRWLSTWLPPPLLRPSRSFPPFPAFLPSSCHRRLSATSAPLFPLFPRSLPRFCCCRFLRFCSRFPPLSLLLASLTNACGCRLSRCCLQVTRSRFFASLPLLPLLPIPTPHLWPPSLQLPPALPLAFLSASPALARRPLS
eukprot:SAG31_NODE_7379_length_1704_cov_2.455452_2_plen_235_part_00